MYWISQKLTRAFLAALLAALITGCAPFTDMTGSGTGTGGCANTLFSISGDSFPSNQEQLSSDQSVAQSFILQPGQSTSGVSLRLDGFSSVVPSTLTGSLSVYVIPDASGSATPSQPNCSPNNCSGSAVASGSLSLSTVILNQPAYYNITFSGPVTVPASSPLAYWIVASVGYIAGGASYVSWDGTSSGGNPQIIAALGITSFTSNWSPAGQNMTFQVCH